MQTQNIYCAACEHQVHVLITDPPTTDGQASLHDSELVCLDVGTSAWAIAARSARARRTRWCGG